MSEKGKGALLTGVAVALAEYVYTLWIAPHFSSTLWQLIVNVLVVGVVAYLVMWGLEWRN